MPLAFFIPRPTRPYLYIRRPSPTTAEFIVSSHPPPTLRLRALHAVLWVLRLLLAVTCVFLLYLNLFPVAVDSDPQVAASPSRLARQIFFGQHHQQQRLPHNPNQDDDEFALHPLVFIHQLHALLHTLVLSSPPTQHLARLAPTLAPWLAAAAALGSIWLATLRARTIETLLVLRGLGVQVHGRFIPTGKILDVLINEAFLGFEVRYYLAVIVEGEEDVVVVFPTLLPGLEVVEAVWKGVRGCLWEGNLVRRAGVDDM